MSVYVRSEFLNDLRHDVRAIRDDVQKHFYFLESEDLRTRPTRGKWSIAEVFAHINIFQAFYIKNIAEVLQDAPEVNSDQVKISWIGKKFIEVMEPVDGQITFKMKTFKKTDPIHRAKKGIVVNEKIVFRDFVNDMEELEELMRLSYDRDIASVKVPTFIPLLKLNIAEAFAVNMAHTERHVLQAKKIIENN